MYFQTEAVPPTTTDCIRITPAAVSSAIGSTRRHDLDWLRVLAFGLLILYHTGMFYVADWSWHIKSGEPSAFLQNIMILTSPWRMSLLFFVSGSALFYASRKIKPQDLLILRNKRLLLPLVFSMAVIVPPQLYVELVSGGETGLSPASFYRQYLDIGTDAWPQHQHGPLGLWTWNHLWFLAYLWVYTLLFVACKPLLDRLSQHLAPTAPTPWVILLLPIAILVFYRLTLAEQYPPSNALIGDWYNHARYLSFLAGGYVLAANGGFWRLAASLRWHCLAWALVAYAAVLGIHHGQAGILLSWLPEPLPALLIKTVISANQWLWILAALGLGATYLNRRGPVLRYMNAAILPWYILHQTLIVLLAFWLTQFSLPQPLEAALLLAGTIGGCALGYELIRRHRLGRILFGLKGA